MSPTAFHAAERRRVTAQQGLRPVTLCWQEGRAFEVPAREGTASNQPDMMMGGSVDQASCRFFVMRSLLESAPRIDTLFTLKDRPQAMTWRLQKVASGYSPNDPEWIFECVEADS